MQFGMVGRDWEILESPDPRFAGMSRRSQGVVREPPREPKLLEKPASKFSYSLASEGALGQVPRACPTQDDSKTPEKPTGGPLQLLRSTSLLVLLLPRCVGPPPGHTPTALGSSRRVRFMKSKGNVSATVRLVLPHRSPREKSHQPFRA